jgi:hypothetical protein
VLEARLNDTAADGRIKIERCVGAIANGETVERDEPSLRHEADPAA